MSLSWRPPSSSFCGREANTTASRLVPGTGRQASRWRMTAPPAGAGTQSGTTRSSRAPPPRSPPARTPPARARVRVERVGLQHDHPLPRKDPIRTRERGVRKSVGVLVVLLLGEELNGLVSNASANLWSMAGLRPPPRAPSTHSLSPPPGGAGARRRELRERGEVGLGGELWVTPNGGATRSSGGGERWRRSRGVEGERESGWRRRWDGEDSVPARTRHLPPRGLSGGVGDEA
jgi:hypothetical protein